MAERTAQLEALYQARHQEPLREKHAAIVEFIDWLLQWPERLQLEAAINDLSAPADPLPDFNRPSTYMEGDSDSWVDHEKTD